MEVEAVVGRTGSLPCDIEPDSHEDRVYMVLWFRHAGGKPLYRLVVYSMHFRGRKPFKFNRRRRRITDDDLAIWFWDPNLLLFKLLLGLSPSTKHHIPVLFGAIGGMYFHLCYSKRLV
ncbi:unnamed protein product [Pieris macdunnoughi]|uniref:Uncharacterized protein n=1 Tax=Pieris macdunnoughi TaxID=345717 RepID=A0A821TYC9_9NEOP|nr:unnamed protein product [Pieris macdunnoughi]